MASLPWRTTRRPAPSRRSNSAGLKLGVANKGIVVVGSNCMKDGMINIKSGKQFATATQIPDRRGRDRGEEGRGAFQWREDEEVRARAGATGSARRMSTSSPPAARTDWCSGIRHGTRNGPAMGRRLETTHSRCRRGDQAVRPKRGSQERHPVASAPRRSAPSAARTARARARWSRSSPACIELDGGIVLVDGKPTTIRSPQHAQELGIALVAQELSLAPALSVLDNIWLGNREVPLFHRRKESSRPRPRRRWKRWDSATCRSRRRCRSSASAGGSLSRSPAC